MQNLINPTSWLANRPRNKPPLIYVAAPVAPRDGECVVTCYSCKAKHAFAASDALELKRVCACDSPVMHTHDAVAVVAYNLARAMRWWKWLDQMLPAVWTMPWYVNVTANGEGNKELIKRGLRDDCEIVKRCDALMLCGPRVSSGMRLEATTAHEAGLPVFQIATPNALGGEPPPHAPDLIPWMEWRP